MTYDSSSFHCLHSPNWLAWIFIAFMLFSPQLLAQPIEQGRTAPASEAPQPIDPNLLVLNAVYQSVYGSSFTCQYRQKTHFFDRTQTAIGTYSHMGQGSNQFKLVVRSTLGDQVNTTQQISDGRMLWTSVGTESTYRTVNLDSVRHGLAKLRRQPKAQPEDALYLAIGGQPELLRSLYVRYRWNKIYAGKIDEQPVWQLVGSLRSEPAAIRTATLHDESLSVVGDAEFPSEVRLTLQRGEPLDLIPLRIEYFTRKASKDGQRNVPESFSTIEYHSIQKVERFADELFTIRPQEESRGREDETQRYLPK